MSHRIRVVDVFTEKPLAGNQLAVVLGADGMAGELMQSIAKEMNLAETTFVLAAETPGHAARIRIFTPGVELPFAGHPTVGTAWVLFDEGLTPGGALEFTLEEGVGPVPVRGVRGDHGIVFWMTHPPVTFIKTISDRDSVAGAIGLDRSDLMPDVPLEVATTGVPFLFVPLKDADAVDRAVPNKEGLSRALGEREARPFFVFTSLGHNRLYSRMFAPHVFDIHEDPATGSASGPLGAFVVKHGLVPRAPTVSIVSEQGTKMGRQAFVHIELTYKSEDDLPARIEVGGSVVPVIEGILSAG